MGPGASPVEDAERLPTGGSDHLAAKLMWASLIGPAEMLVACRCDSV